MRRLFFFLFLLFFHSFIYADYTRTFSTSCTLQRNLVFNNGNGCLYDQGGSGIDIAFECEYSRNASNGDITIRGPFLDGSCYKTFSGPLDPLVGRPVGHGFASGSAKGDLGTCSGGGVTFATDSEGIRTGEQSIWSCGYWRVCDGPFIREGYCEYTFTFSEGIDVSCEDDPSQPWCAKEVFNPPCTDPFPVPDERCKGGMGLWRSGFDNATFLNSTFPDFGNLGCFIEGLVIIPGVEPGPPTSLFRPDESECSLPGTGYPQTCFICPLGLADDYDPSSSSGDAASSDSGGSSSSGASSSSSSRSTMCDLFPGTVLCPSSGSGEPGEPGEPGDPGGGDSGGDYCDANPGSILCVGYGSSASAAVSSASAGQSICEEFPYLAWCQETGGDFSAGSGGGSSAGSGGDPGNPGSGGGVSGGTGDCKDFRDCDWAKLDVQLTQLGVEKEIREQMKDMLGLLNNGYNLSKTQVAALDGLRGDLDALRVSGDNNAVGIVDAINNLASNLHSEDPAGGDNFNSYLRSWDEMLKNHFGASAGSPNGSSAGSSSGSLFGESSGSACEGAGCLPGGEGPADLSVALGRADGIISGGGKGFAPYTSSQIGSLIPASINSGGKCPVISQGFKFVGRTYAKSIDFNNLVPGSTFDLAAFIRGVLLITVYFLNVWTMIRIFQTGGRG